MRKRVINPRKKYDKSISRRERKERNKKQSIFKENVILDDNNAIICEIKLEYGSDDARAIVEKKEMGTMECMQNEYFEEFKDIMQGYYQFVTKNKQKNTKEHRCLFW